MVLLLKKMAMDLAQFTQSGDSRIKTYPIMASTWPIVTILTVYVLFVFKIGPALMKNRKPFNLKNTLIFYNIIQVVTNAWAVYSLFRYLNVTNIQCTPIDWSDTPEAYQALNGYYMYFLLKILDLCDTIFFVLKKNQRQITFLHIYHHILMAGGGWLVLKFLPGGQPVYIALINSFVHVVMYFYYLLTAFDSKWKENVTLKKSITQLQIVQHVVGLTLCVLPLFQQNCDYPKVVLAGYIPQGFMMIFMFSDFYYKSYVKKRKQQ